MKAHFALMAQYNTWANTRLYRMAAELSDEEYRRDVGPYFKSLHGTLNHLLVTDRIWLQRVTGTETRKADARGATSVQLYAILDDLAALTEARRVEDERLSRFVDSLTDAQFDTAIAYTMLSGVWQQYALREVLAHLFNDQTYHRGQAHAILTALGVQEPDSLDVLWMLREQRAC